MKAWLAIDAFVQRVVNVVMFAIMRSTGWSRSSIRFRLMVGPQALSGAVIAGACAATDGGAIGAMLFALYVGGSVALASVERKRDAEAEASGLARCIRGRHGDLAFLGLCAVVECLRPSTTATAAAAFWALQTFNSYAASTPPAPPAKQALVPAAEGA